MDDPFLYILFQLLVALAFAIVMAEPEADANADPYYGYYYNGYGLGYPYRYRVGYYGYPYRYLGKREAEASTLGQVNYDPAFIHPNGALPILAKPIIGAKGDALTTRILDAPYGIPYR